MLQKMRKMIKNDKGFTLIELMVVVVILGILAAIAIPRFVNKTDDALAARAAADTKIVQNAVDLYLVDNLDKKAEDIDSYDDLVTGGYLKAPPVQPDGYTYTIEDGVFTATKE